VIGVYAVGGLVVAPITGLIIATAMAFGPLLGFAYSLLGCLVSAAITYGIGSRLGRETMRRFAGRHVSHLSHRLARHGLTAILIVRILPVAPFTIVNIMAGASEVRFRDFILATFLGMLPGLLVMTFFGDRLQNAIQDPRAESFMILIALDEEERAQLPDDNATLARGMFAAVSYNIHQCVALDGRRDVARIARVLGGLNAQLIGLQEVGTDTEDGRKSSQMEYLARATGLQASAGPTIERQTGPFGNVLLTGWHVLDSRLLDLSVPGGENRVWLLTQT
jgi:phospholipase D1/2